MFKAHDIAKKQHRERHQPTDRKKWGLLEKKKDYRQRAQDYHKKQAHLALLKSKASQANEDEFDYGMIRNRTKDGVLIKQRETSRPLSNDAVKLLKTQDEGYIHTLENQQRKKVERAKENILLPSSGKRTVFVDNEKQMKKWSNKNATTGGAETSEETQREKLAALKETKARIERQKELSKLRQEVDLQRELMKKGPKVKNVDGEGRISYKWLPVRKR